MNAHETSVKRASGTKLTLMQRALSGEATEVPPIWLMRQAGRYLPEYRALRKNFPSFMDFCFSPEAATEATLQPIRRYDFDAAVIFSDILTVPYAMGYDVTFVKNVGPVLTPPTADTLVYEAEKLEPVYEALRLTRAELPANKSLVGFCGMPWTLLLYMYDKDKEKEFAGARRRVVADEEAAALHIERLTCACIAHIRSQIDAGADVVQCFDSWCGYAPLWLRERFCIEPAQRIASAVKSYAPHVKTIWFAKGCGAAPTVYAERVGADALSVDYTVPLNVYAERTTLPLQGNLDPYALLGTEERLRTEVAACRRVMRGKAHIFNLGHGVQQQTSPDRVALLTDLVRGAQQ